MTAPTPPTPRPSAAMQAVTGTSPTFRLLIFCACSAFSFHLTYMLVKYKQPLTVIDAVVIGGPFVFGVALGFPDVLAQIVGLLKSLPLPSFGRHE